jgi:hypothetical protein
MPGLHGPERLPSSPGWLPVKTGRRSGPSASSERTRTWVDGIQAPGGEGYLLSRPLDGPSEGRLQLFLK